MNKINVPKILAGLLSAAVLCFFACCQSQAADPAKKDAGEAPSITDSFVKSDSPIHVNADRMEAKQDERTVVFEGHVLVTQDDLTITSNRLLVKALEENATKEEKGKKKEKQPATQESSPQEKIDYIQFEGDVKVTQQDRLATANKAIFYQKEQKIIMTGRPVVTKGQDRIEGDLITIYLQQGRSVVESGSGTPVKALLFPSKKD